MPAVELGLCACVLGGLDRELVLEGLCALRLSQQAAPSTRRSHHARDARTHAAPDAAAATQRTAIRNAEREARARSAQVGAPACASARMQAAEDALCAARARTRQCRALTARSAPMCRAGAPPRAARRPRTALAASAATVKPSGLLRRVLLRHGMRLVRIPCGSGGKLRRRSVGAARMRSIHGSSMLSLRSSLAALVGTAVTSGSVRCAEPQRTSVGALPALAALPAGRMRRT
jgi:hypothetical protein